MKKMLQLMAALLVVTGSVCAVVIPGKSNNNKLSNIVVPGKTTPKTSDIDGGSALASTSPAMAETTPAVKLLGHNGAGYPPKGLIGAGGAGEPPVAKKSLLGQGGAGYTLLKTGVTLKPVYHGIQIFQSNGARNQGYISIKGKKIANYILGTTTAPDQVAVAKITYGDSVQVVNVDEGDLKAGLKSAFGSWFQKLKDAKAKTGKGFGSFWKGGHGPVIHDDNTVTAAKTVAR